MSSLWLTMRRSSSDHRSFTDELVFALLYPCRPSLEPLIFFSEKKKKIVDEYTSQRRSKNSQINLETRLQKSRL